MTAPRRTRDTRTPAPAPWSRRRVILVALGIAVFAGILYLPSLGNQFVWDDIILIGSPDIRTLDTAAVKRVFTTNFWDVSDATSGMYRPLTTLSFYTDYRIYGNQPAGFHRTNIILNALASALVFLVLLEMFSAPALAVAAALWFAAFPMHVQSVAWISGRTDVIATMFALASLWFYARWHARRRPGDAVASWFCYGLALLGKEVAVVLPAVVAVYELLARAGSPKPRPARRWLVLAGMGVMMVVYFGMRHVLIGSSMSGLPRVTHGLSQAVALSFSIVAHYAYKLLFPFRLNPTSDFQPPVHFLNPYTLAGIAVVAFVIAAVIRWRRHRAFVFGMAVIALGLAPVLHIVPANATLAEHWLYFPSFGYALLVALAFARLFERRRTAAMTVFVVALLACGAQTVMGTRVWKDDLTLFQRAATLSPDNPTARFDYGVSLAQRKRYEEALVEFRRAVELNPSYADAWSAMGRAEAETGRHALGLEHCARAAAIDPTDARFANDLGMMQFQARQYEAAAQSFRHVLELRPRHDYARFNLGLSLFQLRDFDGAIREFTAVENKDADFPNTWFFLAESEFQRGNPDAARQAAAHFLSIHATEDALAARAREIAGQK